MRTFSVQLKNTLTGNTVPLKRAVEIIREDDIAVRFAEVQFAQFIDGIEYPPGYGISVSSIPVELNGSSTRIDMEIVLSDTDLITYTDLRDGIYDNARVIVRLFDYMSLGIPSADLFVGKIGDIEFTDQYSATIECVGLMAQAKELIVEEYTPVCRADLGDKRCKVPIMGFDPEANREYEHGEFIRQRLASTGTPMDYRFDLLWMCITPGTSGALVNANFVGEVGAMINWGSATFQAVPASWTSPAQVHSTDAYNVRLTGLADPRKNQEDWYMNGMVIFRTGKLAGKGYEIRASQGDLLALFVPLEMQPAPGDWVEVFPGCDHSLGPQGNQKFNNIVNYRGEPYAPGPDLLGTQFDFTFDPEGPVAPSQGPGDWDNGLLYSNPGGGNDVAFTKTAETVSLGIPDGTPQSLMHMFSDIEIKGKVYFEFFIRKQELIYTQALGQSAGVTWPGRYGQLPFVGVGGGYMDGETLAFVGCNFWDYLPGLTYPEGSPNNTYGRTTGNLTSMRKGPDSGDYYVTYSINSFRDNPPPIPWGDNDIVMFAIDTDAWKIWYGVNGDWIGGPPDTFEGFDLGAGFEASIRDQPLYAVTVCERGNFDIDIKSGKAKLTYPLPAGFASNGEF